MTQSGCVLSVLAVLACGATARAVVETIDANVTAEVQELAGGAVVNADLAFDELGVTTQNLPLAAQANLVSPSLGEASTSPAIVGSASAFFRDPRLNVAAPPNEFSLEAVGFSLSESSTVSGRSSAVERRQVVFQPDEVDLDAGTAVTARSHFFLDGVLVVLGQPGQPSLAGSRTELTVRVIQARSGAAETVLETTVVLSGNSDGTAALEVNGALTADDLNTFGAEELGVAEANFRAVALPNLAIPYTYPADIGETFELRAEIEIRSEAGPGTGGAAVLGDRVNQLVDVLREVLGEQLAAKFEAGLSVGLSEAELPSETVVAAVQETILEVADGQTRGIPLFGGALCGAMGVESMLLAAGLAVLGVIARKRI